MTYSKLRNNSKQPKAIENNPKQSKQAKADQKNPKKSLKLT